MTKHSDTPSDPISIAAKAPPSDDPLYDRHHRWRRPLHGRWDRAKAWINMFFVDHAFFRVAYLNLHRLSPRAWRSAQPLPHQIRRLARQGLRSVVTLRGGKSFGSLPLEIEACFQADVHFDTFEMRSRALPTRAQVEAAVELFQRLEYPVLFHCKSGADRAGMMAALFMALHEGVPVAQARRQLSLRYGHIASSKTGILDSFFDAYEADQPDGAMPLLDWVRTRYDPVALTHAYKSGKIADLLTDRLLGRE